MTFDERQELILCQKPKVFFGISIVSPRIIGICLTAVSFIISTEAVFSRETYLTSQGDKVRVTTDSSDFTVAEKPGNEIIQHWCAAREAAQRFIPDVIETDLLSSPELPAGRTVRVSIEQRTNGAQITGFDTIGYLKTTLTLDAAWQFCLRESEK